MHSRQRFCLVYLLIMLAIFSIVGAGCSAISNDSGNAETMQEQAGPDAQAELQQHVEEVQANSERLASMIHEGINDQRKINGLNSLQWDSDLASIALSHSKDMAVRNYFDHVSPDGKDFQARYQQYGYHKQTRVGDVTYVGGENLFLYSVIESTTTHKNTGEVFEYKFNDLQDLARATVDGWMGSQGHRDNILTPFTREGIGVFVTADGKVYVTENFS
ncbi:MAG: hypothetical protein A2V52_01135 [Actinobacteria bacterium RBG_19FT_COMBO_54_7]|nr:MAG: hypothetical protein A2V52_01135 [Actinobacteria bacterium RBG_19FT_COMBO_54_7]